jgi:hypothetical protein
MAAKNKREKSGKIERCPALQAASCLRRKGSDVQKPLCPGELYGDGDRDQEGE